MAVQSPEQQSVGIKILKTVHSLFIELFSGAMAFHCLCTMCGIEDFIKLVQGSQVQAALCRSALLSCVSSLRIL